jgi:O-antigen ligase
MGNPINRNLQDLSSDVEKIAAQTDDVGLVGSTRYAIWQRTIAIIPHRPVFGYGPKQTLGAYRDGGINHTRPHNEFLQHALVMGIPAAILYLASLIWLFVYLMRRVKSPFNCHHVSTGSDQLLDFFDVWLHDTVDNTILINASGNGS